MKIFITGGTGFIGSHFIDAAIKEGHEIIALTRDKVNKNNSNNRINWLKKDLLKINSNDLIGVDILFNLASAGVSPKKASIKELTETNILGSINLMQESIKANVKRTVFIGTCFEYGLSADKYKRIPSDAPLLPTNNYAKSKVASFYMLEALCKTYKTEFLYPRLFSVYGIGQNEMNFWPSLRKAALNGSDFKMTEGKQIRDFIPVEKVVFHLISCCYRKDVIKSIPFIFNIGSGSPVSIFEFAKTQWDKFEAKGKLINGAIPDRANEPKSFIPDLNNLYQKNSL